ncbi:gp53-like domain-containing protein [Sphingomonas sp. NPDC079357]|uniref:pyocin knob domain-containing protein n=1 Tax=Sphingomonas sp. NPDC079357 TaxID=3364518 RepID=UPI00384D178F
MALQLVITNAGRAAIVDQAKGGFRAVRIDAVGVSPTAISAAATATALAGEVKRITTIAGDATAADVVHLTVNDESSDGYTVRSFALYLSDGTLFALYGQADPIVQKSAQALLLLAIDVALSNIPAAQITFGSANFINPAATTERAGVAELATDAEVAAGKDTQRIVTPAAAAKLYAALTGAGFTGAVTVGAAGVGRVALSPSGGAAATGAVEFIRSTGVREGYIGLAPSGGQIQLLSDNGAGFNVAGGPLTHGGAIVWDAANDGAGSGLDADLLDGRHATDFALLSGAGFTGTVTVGAASVGRVALYQAGGAANTGYLAFIRSTGVREGYIGFAPTGGQIQLLSENGAGFNVAGGPLTHGGATVWDAANDGAGSGLDADLLDGKHGTDFAGDRGAVASTQLNTAKTPGYYRVSYPNFSDTLLVWQSASSTGTVQLAAGFTGRLEWRNCVDDKTWSAWRTIWHAENDGAGSGLDADLLDGWHRDDVRDWGNLLNRPATFPPAAHSHGAGDIAGAFTGSLAANGYTVLPNGLILQWLNVSTPTGEVAFDVTWPIAFPNACLNVVTTAQIAAISNRADVGFQLIGDPGPSGATIMRQFYSDWATSVTIGARILAIGY